MNCFDGFLMNKPRLLKYSAAGLFVYQTIADMT